MSNSPANAPRSGQLESIVETAWRRRTFVATVTLLVLLCAAVALVIIPKRYTAEVKIEVKVPGDQGNLATLLNTQVELIKSGIILSTALDAPQMNDITLFPDGVEKVRFLKGAIDVRPVENASLIVIRMASTQPAGAVEMINAIATAYVSHVKEQRNNVSQQTYKDLADNYAKQYAEREKLKLRHGELTEQTGGHLPDGAAKTNLVLQKVKQLSDEVTTAELATKDLQAQRDASITALGWTDDQISDERLAQATAVSAQRLPTLRANLAGYSQQLVEAKRRFVPTHPAVRGVKAQIKDLQLSEAATLTKMLADAKANEKKLRDELLEQNEIAKTLDQKSAELIEVDSALKVANKSLEILDTQIATLRASETVGFSATQLDPPAVDENSAVPNTWKTLGLASIVGLLVALMSTLLREWISPSLGSVHRIADTIGVPVLGTLPRISGSTLRDLTLITHQVPDSPAAEAFRSIRTSMLFGAGECRTLTITSASPRDGKTTLGTNLAVSLAQSGKRVVLVDANFKSPILHQVFDIDNGIGVTGVLSGDDLETSLRRTVVEHLDVLTAGPRMPEVSEKLNSNSFNDLLHDLTSRYDHIIFDSSSVSESNDARVIAAGCDQTILVVRGERSNRYAATAARDALLSVGANLMGIVVNDLQNTPTVYPPGGRDGGTGGRDATLERAAELARKMQATR